MQENGATILFVSHDVSAVKALCSRTILLNNGRVEADGRPAEVLNRYQGLIMEREEAYDAVQESPPLGATAPPGSGDADVATPRLPLRYSYRHGDGSAQVISAELLNSDRAPADLVDTGDPLLARMRVHFVADCANPVFGFLIRNRHGIHAYGLNTEQRGLRTGSFKAGEVVEVTFSFDCWLGTDSYSVSFAVHSEDGVSYDWIDGVLFFRVACAPPVEGVANLSASAIVRRIGVAGGVAVDKREPVTTE